MTYIVQTEGPHDHSAASVALEDRKEALKTAMNWVNEGRTVRIIGNGNTPEQLALAIINNE
jgi:UDP-N-acetylmuramyl tripeptide synthase